MKRPFSQSALLAILLSVLGCSMPEGMNEHCGWPAGAQDAERTVVADVRIAEELAMRYADANFDSRASHGRFRSDCESKLFVPIAQHHGVSLDAIESARQELNANVWDAPVHLPLIALYIVLAVFLAGWVRRRFERDEVIPAAIATLFVSLVIAVVVQVLGGLWDGTIEMVRLGTTHLSYRVERLGWHQYSEEVFALSVALFWCAVIVHYRIRADAAPSPGKRLGAR